MDFTLHVLRSTTAVIVNALFLDSFCTTIWYLLYSIHVSLVKFNYIEF